MNITNLQLQFVKGAERANLKLVPALECFSNVIQLDGAYKDDIIKTPFAETGSASSDFSFTTGVTENLSSFDGKSITVNVWKQQVWTIKDSDWPRLNDEAVAQEGEVRINQLFTDVSVNLLNSVTSSFANFTVSSGSNWGTMNAMANLVAKTQTNNWGTAEKYLIPGPTIQGCMLGSTLGQNVLNAAALAMNRGDSGAAVQNGELGKWVGFNVRPTSTEAIPSTILGLATNKRACGVVLAYPKPPQESNGVIYKADRVVDPATGYVYGTRIFYDNFHYTTYFIAEVLAGIAVLNPKNAFNLLVTDVAV